MRKVCARQLRCPPPSNFWTMWYDGRLGRGGGTAGLPKIWSAIILNEVQTGDQLQQQPWWNDISLVLAFWQWKIERMWVLPVSVMPWSRRCAIYGSDCYKALQHRVWILKGRKCSLFLLDFLKMWLLYFWDSSVDLLQLSFPDSVLILGPSLGWYMVCAT